MTEEELRGLRGEVIDADVYGLRKLAIKPDVVFDLGANVGCFVHLARAVFPQARIIAVEPDAENFKALSAKFHSDPRVELINAAIGSGTVYRARGAANGAMECYLTAGVGYPADELAKNDQLDAVAVKTVTVAQLVKQYAVGTYVIKMDIEGGEAFVFTHRPSIEAMKGAAYLTIELHRYAINGAYTDEVNRVTDAVLAEFAQTHECTQEHVIWRAMRKT